jgi:hypothetical protein
MRGGHLKFKESIDSSNIERADWGDNGDMKADAIGGEVGGTWHKGGGQAGPVIVGGGWVI